MVTCEPLLLGSHVLDKYRACKQEFNFDKGTDEMFLDFLLDTSVKVIDIMKHLNPVLNTVTCSTDSPAYSLTGTSNTNRSSGSQGHQHTTSHYKTSKHLAECMKCRPTVHRPLFQPPAPCPHVTPSHVPPLSRSPAKKFVQKLPNFVKPTVSKDHKLSEKNFVEFKCSPQIPVSEKRTVSSDQGQSSSNFIQNTASNSHNTFTNSNPIEVGLPTSSSAAETIDNLNAEISQFEKEIGNVLESLTQSGTEQDISVKRLSEGNRALSMIGMRQCEAQDYKQSEIGQKLYSGKHSYTRLNSRYKKYPDEMLKQAMQSVQLGYKTVAQAAKEYNIPRQTLQYRLFKRKKKFHVFAPNIPYTNNFFIENYNNTQTDVSESAKSSKIRSPEHVLSDDVMMDPQTDVSGSGTFVSESDLRFNLEQTVKELLQCSENILTDSSPELGGDTLDSSPQLGGDTLDTNTVPLGPCQSESDNFQVQVTAGQILPSDTDIVIDDVISDIRAEIAGRNTESESETRGRESVIELD